MFVTRPLDKGIPVKDAMKLSHHKNFSSFERYMAVSESRLVEHVNRLDEID